MNTLEKQGVNEVLKKYDRSGWDTTKSYLRLLAFGAGVGFVTSLFLTGVILPCIAIGAAVMPGLKGTFRLGSKLNIWHDKEKQKIQAPVDVKAILHDISANLSAAFSATTYQSNSGITLAKFLETAKELEADVNKLLPAVNIIDGGRRGLGTDKYVISFPSAYMSSNSARITIDDARNDVQKRIAEREANLQRGDNPNGWLQERISSLEERLGRVASVVEAFQYAVAKTIQGPVAELDKPKIPAPAVLKPGEPS